MFGFGWDIDTDFSKPRGLIFPIGSFGATATLETLFGVAVVNIGLAATLLPSALRSGNADRAAG